VKNTAHTQAWMNDLYIFKYLLNTACIHICIKCEKDLIDDPRHVSFLFFQKRSSKEKNMWFWLVNPVMNSAQKKERKKKNEHSPDSVGQCVSSTPPQTSD
jgi:hypothetical protein